MKDQNRSAFVYSAILALALVILATGCRSEPGVFPTSNGSATTVSQAPSTAEGQLSFPFSTVGLPPPVFDRGQYLFTPVTPDELDRYLARLVGEGFLLQRDEYRCYLQKDNVFIKISNNTQALGKLSLVYYEGLAETRPGTLSPAQAQAAIGGDPLSIMEVYVPDLFEKTGAQLFYAMPQTLGYGNPPSRYLVRDKQVFLLDTIFNDYQVFDIDRDGHAELLVLRPGPTSGMFSIGIEVVGFSGGAIRSRYKQWLMLDYYHVVLHVDGKMAALYAAEYEGTQLIPKTPLFQLVVKNHELTFIDLRKSDSSEH
jgi:hypothetical protein